MRKATISIIALAMTMLFAGAALATHVFPDVADDNTHADGIHWSHENGVVVGYEDGTFGPEDNITRGQAASMFNRYHDAFAPNDGADGKDGVSNAITTKQTADIVNLQPGAEGTATSTCPEATQSAIGGGHKIDGNPSKAFELIRSQPIGNYEGGMFDAWEVTVRNTGDVEIDVQVALICADVN